MSIENRDEGCQRIVEYAIEVAGGAFAASAVSLDRDFGRFEGSYDIADPNLIDRSRQPHATVSTAKGFQEARMRKYVDDLENIERRDAQALRDVSSLDELVTGRRTISHDCRRREQ